MMLEAEVLRYFKGLIEGRNGLFILSLGSKGGRLQGGIPELFLPLAKVIGRQSGTNGQKPDKEDN
jgi:hypothetical protein